MGASRVWRRLVVLLAVVLAGAAVAAVVVLRVIRPAEYVLAAEDARGIQAGDPVVEQGVVVGRVTRVEFVAPRPEVHFHFQDRTHGLRTDAVVWIHKPLTAARAEVRILGGCSDSTVIPAGSVLVAATMVERLALRGECEMLPRWRVVERWVEEKD